MIVRSLVLAFMLGLLGGCSDEATPIFHQGEMVKHKISGYQGQVTYVFCNARRCYYNVRFAFQQSKTNVSLLGPDGAVEQQPIALIEYMHDFELEKIK